MSCAHCEDLEERVAWLESELGLRIDADEILRLKSGFNTTPNGARILRMLYRAKGGAVTHYQLDEALSPPDRPEGREAQNVPVYICKLRKRLGPDTIRNAWGQGYSLTREGMARVGAVLHPQQAVAA